MTQPCFALLVHNGSTAFEPLRQVLKELSVETCSVATCEEANDLISQCKPHLIFTQSSLVDGSWMTISNMADAAEVPVSVIVVGEHSDTHHYLSVIERGAFDYLSPPFEPGPLKFVVRSAALNSQFRRKAMEMRPVLGEPSDKSPRKSGHQKKLYQDYNAKEHSPLLAHVK